MSNPKLNWKDPMGGEKWFEIESDQVLIGRKSDSDIVLPNPYISRHHAKIIREGDDCFLADLNSTHGTYVNGRRAEPRQNLRSGDRIGVGRDQVEIVFYSDAAPPLEEDPVESSEAEAMQTAFMNLTRMMPSQETGQSELEKFSLLLDFQYQWGQHTSGEAMFHQILASALQISGAERGYVLRRLERGFEYARGLDHQGNVLSEADFRTSQSVVKQVAEEGKPVFMTEGISGEFAQQESIVAMNLRAVACMPLTGIAPDSDTPQLLGILYLDSTKTMHALSGLDQKILSRLADEAGNVIEKIEMIRGLQERQKLESELALARETQVTLLPQKVPQVEGFLIRAFSRPTRHVGGDFYDFIDLPNGKLGGILADVSGKGVSASLLSSSLQGALHMQFRAGAPPDRAFNELNRFTCERSQANRFCTLFFFTLDREDGAGEFISAGHNPSFLFRSASGTVDQLDSAGLILGAFEFATYQAHPFRLDPGDILLVYSDGLTEAENPSEDMYGEERLIELLKNSGASGGEAVEDKIFETLEEFTQGHDQTDDITFMLIERLKLAGDQ
ncbi:MAG TPA: SpoIIE family protein phosphatase [Acidobacteriota bacterium]|nr:SpoIIE family protein phosphatase [Acidobacteriota bacterium]